MMASFGLADGADWAWATGAAGAAWDGPLGAAAWVGPAAGGVVGPALWLAGGEVGDGPNPARGRATSQPATSDSVKRLLTAAVSAVLTVLLISSLRHRNRR